MLDRFSVTATVTVRPCAQSDLPDLEWYGLFTRHRRLIDAAYGRQQRGEVLMLVAERAGFPVGQIWIDFAAGRAGAARLWAFRVLPCLQGLGIGSRLMAAAERAVAARATVAEVGCLKSNSRARRFYEERGYVFAYDELDRYSYDTPAGEHVEAASDQWILRKRLGHT